MCVQGFAHDLELFKKYGGVVGSVCFSFVLTYFSIKWHKLISDLIMFKVNTIIYWLFRFKIDANLSYLDFFSCLSSR